MKIFKWFVILIITGFLFGTLIFTLTLPRIPDNLNEIALSNPTKIYSDDGQLVKVFADRQVVEISQISDHFIQAILTLEDSDFYHHHGISKRSLLRAFLTNIKNLGISQGGSTITQQLAKNLFFGFDRSVFRKIKELFVALQLEQQFSKQEILEAYVNQINFGSGVYGVELAAQTYFAKHADELSLAEAAMLAGIPRWPVRYNPNKNFEIAKERQAFVLNRMVDENAISPDEKDNALETEISLKPLNPYLGHVEYFIDAVKNKAIEKYGSKAVNYGGLEIYTSLNARYQYEANRALQKELSELDARLGLPAYEDASWEQKLHYPQAAMVVLDPNSGEIKGLIGGRDYKRSQFNRALSNNRHPGSSFKPFTYLTALDKQIVEPTTVLVDEPITFKIYKQEWSPQNFDKTYDGPMIIKWALLNSVNVIAAKLINKVKPENTIEYARKLGITSELDENLSLALGAVGVSPLELTRAYATIANLGIRRELFFIDRIKIENKTIELKEPSSKRVIDQQTCYLLLDMLKGVVEHGTAKNIRRAGIYNPCAGKTGTTNDYRDSWFVGFTPELVVGIWVGFDDNREMITKNGVGITGATGALPIWIRFMQKILKDSIFSEFPIPPGIAFKEVDPRTGAGPLPGGPSITVAIRAD